MIRPQAFCVPFPRLDPRAGRVGAALVVAGALSLAPLVDAPLGRLGSAFALLLVLPPLAASLAALGWRDRAATRLRQLRGDVRPAVVGYVAWALASALLGLDVGVLIGASVAMAMGPAASRARRAQLRAAIVGANAGSMLFPFSNLTNLVVLAGSGVTFARYVAVALPVQVAVAVAGGLAVAVGARVSHDAGAGRQDAGADTPASAPGPAPGKPPAAAQPHLAPARACSPAESPDAGDAAVGTSRAASLAALAAVTGGAVAVVAGFAGADVVVPFALASAAATSIALLDGRLTVSAVLGSLPRVALVVVAGAALLAAPLAGVAAAVPGPPAGPAGLAIAVVAGSAIALVLNNLPAALVGALWLHGADAPTVVAFLVGTNVGSIATPHGSVATMLARSLARDDGEPVSAIRYLAAGWRYALPPVVAALLVLAAVR